MIYAVIIGILATLMFAGSFFVYRGFRMSIKRGVRNVFTLLSATLLSVGSARLISKDYETLPLSSSLLQMVRGILTDYDMYTPRMETILNATVERITYTALIAVFFVVIFTIIVVAFTIFDHMQKKYRVTSFKHRRLFNTCFSFLTGGYLVIFALFAPPINIAAEAPNIDTAVTTIRAISDGNINEAAGNISLITKALMNTKIIAADENERLDLIGSAIAAGAARQSNPMVAALLSGLSFTSAEEIKAEAEKLERFVNILGEDGITPQMLADGQFTFDTFREMEHTDELVEVLYSMKGFDGIVRTVLTYGIQAFSGDPDYKYPDDIPIKPESKDELKTAISVLPDLYVSMMLQKSNSITREQASDANWKIEQLKHLSFISNEVYLQLKGYIGL